MYTYTFEQCFGPKYISEFVLKSKKLASDNVFSQKISVWETTEKIFSCQNLDLSLS